MMVKHSLILVWLAITLFYLHVVKNSLTNFLIAMCKHSIQAQAKGNVGGLTGRQAP